MWRGMDGWRDEGEFEVGREQDRERGVILPPQPAPESTRKIPYAPINTRPLTLTYIPIHTQDTSDILDWGQSKLPKCAQPM